MKFEFDLLTPSGINVVPLPLSATGRVNPTDARREIRMATDELIIEGLRSDGLQPMLNAACDTMLTLTRALIRHNLVPHVGHFVESATALVEDARTVFDAGMRVDDFDKAMIGAVMIELTVRGIFATVSQDYEAAMKERYASENQRQGIVGGAGTDAGGSDNGAVDAAAGDAPLGLDVGGGNDRPH